MERLHAAQVDFAGLHETAVGEFGWNQQDCMIRMNGVRMESTGLSDSDVGEFGWNMQHGPGRGATAFRWLNDDLVGGSAGLAG